MSIEESELWSFTVEFLKLILIYFHLMTNEDLNQADISVNGKNIRD